MKRLAALPLCFLLLAAGVQAATVNTTLTVTNAAFALSGTTASASGTAALTGLGASGATLNGTFSSSISLTAITGATITPAFTLTFSGGTLTGTLTIPTTALTGSGPLTGSATISSGTGSYAGYTGSFSSLTGSTSGSITSTLTLSFSGAGTINTSGSTGGGTGGGSTAPTITAVLDAGSYTSSIAQGSMFVVKGSNLAAGQLAQFGFPLPTSSGGVTITFTPTSGGNGTNAYLLYTLPQQLAGVLPSAMATGSYSVTVSYNNQTSAAFPATVAKQKPGLFTQDATGSGLVLAQNYVSATEYDLNRLTSGVVNGYTISPAEPGHTVILYATGLGAVSGGDNAASLGYNYGANGVTVQAIVGGVTIPAAYAGAVAGFAAFDQINIALPNTIPTGCTVPVQLSVNGVLSAPATISIASSASPTACIQPGFTQSQLQSLDNGGTITSGGFSLTQIQESVPPVGNVKIDSVGGSFSQFTGFQLAAAAQYTVTTSTSGACQVINVSGSGSALGSGSVTGLDAGAVSLNGPSGSSITNLALTESSSGDSYSLTLGEEGLPVSIPGSPNASLVAGTYTLSGAGGKDVGSFKVSISLGTPLTLNPALPSTVTRSAGLPLSWTGGNSTDVVEIVGYSGTSTTSGTTTTTNATEFICTTTAGTGGFTVPASVLTQLPATPASTSGGSGFLEVSSGPTPSPFTPTLTAGGTVSSTFAAFIGSGALVTYQ